MSYQHTKRTVVRVHWIEDKKVWSAAVDKNVIYTAKTVETMMRVLRPMMNNVMLAGFKGQIVVHEKDGTIGFEHTYPDDTPEEKS